MKKITARTILATLPLLCCLVLFGCGKDSVEVVEQPKPAETVNTVEQEKVENGAEQTASGTAASSAKKEDGSDSTTQKLNGGSEKSDDATDDTADKSDDEGFFDENWKPKERLEVEVQTIDIPKTWKRIGKQGVDEVWVDSKAKECIVAGYICQDENALEMFACPRGTKEHESVVAVNSSSEVVHMALLLTGVDKGKPVQWAPDYVPASGPVIEIMLLWKDEKTGKTIRRNAKEMVVNVETKKEMQHDWVFGGSQVVEHDGQAIYYANAGELVCLSNFSTATMDVPIQSTDAANGLLFGANKEKIPELGTKVYMIFRPTGEIIKPVAPTKREDLLSEPDKTKAPSDADKAETKPDLSVPMFDPKPVVWIDDWKPTQQKPSLERFNADQIVAVADQLKSAEQYEKAESAYQVATTADPSWAYPHYQLACNYELWDQHEKAVPEFKKAIELGFSDFPTALADNELGELRNADDFESTLAMLRERYIQDSEERIGTPIAIKPEGKPPEDGWPMILMLHGYGDSHLNYIPFARAWAKLGFVAVTVPGSVPNQTGGFIWGLKSTETTLNDLRKITNSKLIRDITNDKSVHLYGFSQGALHSMLIATEHRDEFKSVVAFSPGGSLVNQIVTPKISDGRSGNLVFIHGSKEPHAPIGESWKKACADSGWEFMTHVHEGGHHFPDDLEVRRAKIAEFILK